jgi:hypothetical protein
MTKDELKGYARNCPDYSRVEYVKPHGGKLAIVGGSPSLQDHLKELKGWDGDIWSVNYTAAWLHNQGIESTMIAIDPELIIDTPVESILLATCCHPDMMEKIKGKNVRVFDLIETALDGIGGGTSTAGRMPTLAIRMGYTDITFFGCEGSFVDSDHVDRDEAPQDLLIIRANNHDYKTRLPYIHQCETLVPFLKDYPEIFKDKSGGLLNAMTVDDNWEVVAVSGPLKKALEEQNGDNGIFEGKYVSIN